MNSLRRTLRDHPAMRVALTAICLLAAIAPSTEVAAVTEPTQVDPDTNETVEVGVIDTTPVTSAPSKLTQPLVPVPTGCDVPELPFVVFIGTVVGGDYRTTRFRIDQVRATKTDKLNPNDMVDIRYGQDTQYLEKGETYLVGAGLDPDLRVLMSRVTPAVAAFGGDEVVGVTDTDVECEEIEDPVRTLYPDGTPVDGAVLQPIRKAWVQVAIAIGQTFLVAIAIVFVLALLRNVLRAAWHALVVSEP